MKVGIRWLTTSSGLSAQLNNVQIPFDEEDALDQLKAQISYLTGLSPQHQTILAPVNDTNDFHRLAIHEGTMLVVLSGDDRMLPTNPQPQPLTADDRDASTTSPMHRFSTTDFDGGVSPKLLSPPTPQPAVSRFSNTYGVRLQRKTEVQLERERATRLQRSGSAAIKNTPQPVVFGAPSETVVPWPPHDGRSPWLPPPPSTTEAGSLSDRPSGAGGSYLEGLTKKKMLSSARTDPASRTEKRAATSVSAASSGQNSHRNSSSSRCDEQPKTEALNEAGGSPVTIGAMAMADDGAALDKLDGKADGRTSSAECVDANTESRFEERSKSERRRQPSPAVAPAYPPRQTQHAQRMAVLGQQKRAAAKSKARVDLAKPTRSSTPRRAPASGVVVPEHISSAPPITVIYDEPPPAPLHAPPQVHLGAPQSQLHRTSLDLMKMTIPSPDLAPAPPLAPCTARWEICRLRPAVPSERLR